jgi:hypothetical protein
MVYIIHIKNNKTGEIRQSKHDYEFGEFMWVEGSYSCDCNRALFFYAHDEEAYNQTCGEKDFSITDVHLEDGSRDEEMETFARCWM